MDQSIRNLLALVGNIFLFAGALVVVVAGWCRIVWEMRDESRPVVVATQERKHHDG